LELTRAIAESVQIPVIAPAEQANANIFMLHSLRQSRRRPASLLHYGQLSVAQIKTYLSDHACPVGWSLRDSANCLSKDF